ncbi:MAG TPA: outer membrane beta-barrel domain-containing protein [Woeseiaceae bacterium]|nr:outer membrane beta-barrel domain-containing protein [Woeseiaceae bacterium]
MESRLRILFLVLPLLFGMSGCAATRGLFGLGDEEPPRSQPAEAPSTEQVIEPEVVRRDVSEPQIDTENFEIGAFAGVMSIEDFGSDLVYGARLAYHITEGVFMEGTIGQSQAGLTSFEELSGGAPILSDSDRTFTYYNLDLGYNLLPGEVFLGEGRAYNTSLYVIGGLGSMRFAGDDRFTVNVGAGYRFLLTDSVTLHLDFRDHLFDTDLLGEQKTVHNIEAHMGMTFFF